MRIRHKLLISYSLVLVLSISLGSSSIYFFVRDRLKANLESELNNTTTTILNMVRTSAAVSIKNHLRAVAEKNLEIIGYLHGQHQKGLLSLSAAQELAASLLLAQSIGDTGYNYCLDSQGVVTVHPQASLIHTDVSGFAFVAEQLARKRGYIEYDWKNPGDSVSRPKALYMLYFEPWDWIVSTSSYRDEFKRLVNVEDFEKSVLDLRFGKGGYSFVLDGNGNAIIHPKLQGINIFDAQGLPNRHLKEMHRQKTGKMVYPWKNPGETSARSKLVIFNHIPEYDWIVASSGYLEELYAPMRTIRNLIIATACGTFLFILPISFKIGASITTPLQNLMQGFNRMTSGDFSSRMVPESNDEVGQLAIYYNRFMDQIEDYRNDLNKQMDERNKIEEALRESEARYRSVMEAVPDPIVVYDMNGLVTYFNPAFTRVFGWTLESCLGKKMDHFVPEENWDETGKMISAVLSGETLSAIPTRRYTRNGAIVDVSISGATYRNRHGELDGSVIILRDVTKSRELQKQVMEIGDRVRRRIGQDLHDDLCPHLIGIHGLSTVLAENLREASSADLPLAQKIVELIGSSIKKTRSLARGLCPVHLVAHGLFAALGDMARHTGAMFPLSCRFEGDEQVVLADNTVATHLYYIAQEAVQNAVKHADADQIAIALTKEGTKIHLRVSDNGKGIPARVKSSGIGLQIMQYRARIINAVFQITGDRERGTTVHVLLDAALQDDRRH